MTGTPPYGSDSVERLIAAHLLEPAPRPSQLRPGSVPQSLDPVIAKGMAKNPEERYRSAGELAAAANDALTASDQHQAATILRRGERAVSPAGVGNTGLAGDRPIPERRTTEAALFRQKYRPAPRQWLVPCRPALAPAAGAADPARRHPLARAGHQRLANHLVHRLLTSGPSPAENVSGGSLSPLLRHW